MSDCKILQLSASVMAFPPPSFLFRSLHEDRDQLNPSSLNTLPSCPTSHFHGGAPFMMKRSMSFSGIENKCDEGHDDELSDDGSQLGEKKKRLNVEQVKALEKSFEIGNKLEPERKMQLAKTLCLQPRQVAIWFQNRRARWKTKQLEKDYEVLKKQFEALKSDNDALHAQNKKLHEELVALKGRGNSEAGTIGHKKEKEGSWSNRSDSNSDIHLEISRNPVVNSSLSRPPSIAQFLQGSSRSDLHGLKLDHIVQEENFCSIFISGMDEQQHNFWPWPAEQQHFH